MMTGEFKEAVFYHGTDDDPARYRVDVKYHKTAGVYGAAIVWIYDNLYVLIDMYIRTVRCQLIPTDSEVQRYLSLAMAFYLRHPRFHIPYLEHFKGKAFKLEEGSAQTQ